MYDSLLKPARITCINEILIYACMYVRRCEWMYVRKCTDYLCYNLILPYYLKLLNHFSVEVFDYYLRAVNIATTLLTKIC